MSTFNANILQKTVKLGTVVLSLNIFAACQNMNNDAVGTIVGGTVGGVVGNQIGGGTGKIVATLGGAIVGAVLGNAVGHSMDEVDRMKLNRALEHSRTDVTTTWENPDEKVTYSVTPLKTLSARDGQPCREYSFTATIGGREKQVYGKACRDAAGNWKTVG